MTIKDYLNSLNLLGFLRFIFDYSFYGIGVKLVLALILLASDLILLVAYLTIGLMAVIFLLEKRKNELAGLAFYVFAPIFVGDIFSDYVPFLYIISIASTLFYFYILKINLEKEYAPNSEGAWDRVNKYYFDKTFDDIDQNLTDKEEKKLIDFDEIEKKLDDKYTEIKTKESFERFNKYRRNKEFEEN